MQINSLADWLSREAEPSVPDKEKMGLQRHINAVAGAIEALYSQQRDQSMKYWWKPAKFLRKMSSIVSYGEKMFRERIRMTFVFCYNNSRDKFLQRVFLSLLC